MGTPGSSPACGAGMSIQVRGQRNTEGGVLQPASALISSSRGDRMLPTGAPADHSPADALAEVEPAT